MSQISNKPECTGEEVVSGKESTDGKDSDLRLKAKIRLERKLDDCSTVTIAGR